MKLSEEDLKAIERIEDIFYQDLGKGINKFQKITLYEDRIADIKKLLNLIENQQKEIEEYKKFKKDIVSKIMIWDKEELPDNEAIISILDTFKAEVSRLEDIEDKKVEVAVDCIEKKRDKFWKDKIREFIKKELPDDEIMKWNIIYDVNGIDLRKKLEELLEEK